jgi:curved DNA-binding protein
MQSADAGAYSEFFESLFGHGMGPQASAGPQQGFHARGEDHHAKVLIDLEDAYTGGSHSIGLRTPELDKSGHVITKDRTLNVKIPKGIRQGQKIRLSGQGSPGHGNGKAGDLYLEIEFRPHSFYRPDGKDVYIDLPLAPWEAALGATVKVPTPDGPVDMKIPAGTRNDQKLRLKGRGIPGKPPGSIYVVAKLTLPPANSDAEKEFYKKMQQDLPYNPRGHLEV